MQTTRRQLLGLALAGLAASACGRVADRASTDVETATPASLPEVTAWTTEARAMLSDTLAALQTFEIFQAFRVSTAAQSTMRSSSELAWDPPTGAAWDEATHVTRGLHGRADQLFLAIASANIDPSFWRDQRRLADATHDLLDLGDALSAYRDRIDLLPPGDGSSALNLLDKAWAQWDAAAARWGVSRSEPVPGVTP